MSSNSVFWYHVGRVAVHVQIEGESKLISPHSFFLAPAAQKFPPRIANLFKKKDPPADLRAKFEQGGLISEERQKRIDKETRLAQQAKEDAEKARSSAQRKGEAVPRMPLADAVSEEGKKDPKSESESKPEEPPQNETRAQRKKRIKAEKEAARLAAEEADKEKDEQGDES